MQRRSFIKPLSHLIATERLKPLLILFAWLLTFQAISAAIGLTTAPDIKGWYGALARPAFAPPNYVFPIVWPVLYALIAAAGWRIFCRGSKMKNQLLKWLFSAYMALNWTWSFVFFSLHMIFAGLIWILCMDACALWLILRAWRVDRGVSYLMLPPLAWTIFAAILNGAYWWLNR